jgi:hypothetical protein
MPDNTIQFEQNGKFIMEMVKHVDQRFVHALRFHLRWNDHVSNSHSCPLNGVENWQRELDKPRSYPGWQGQVWFGIVSELADKSLDSYSSSFGIIKPPLNTGSGSGAGSGAAFGYKHAHSAGYKDSTSKYKYGSYDFKVFADDFPDFVDHEFREANTMRTLQGKSSLSPPTFGQYWLSDNYAEPDKNKTAPDKDASDLILSLSTRGPELILTY